MEKSRWDEFISDRQDHQVALIKALGREHLSDSEIDLIDEVYKVHGHQDQWQLRDWCHEHCEEWTPLEQGREQIGIERMARAVGKTEEQIARLKEEVQEIQFLSAAFHH